MYYKYLIPGNLILCLVILKFTTTFTYQKITTELFSLTLYTFTLHVIFIWNILKYFNFHHNNKH